MSEKETRGRNLYQKNKGLLTAVSRMAGMLPMKLRIKLFEHFRYRRGIIGVGFRYALFKSIAISCGDNVLIGEGVFIIHPQNMIVGSNVSIHPMCYIGCGSKENGRIRIDDDVSIAHGTTVMATSHNYRSDNTDIIKDMGVAAQSVHIHSNVWIGAKASILMGVSIGSGCVIGAHSLVNKDTDPDGIYAGTPARRIKDR